MKPHLLLAWIFLILAGCATEDFTLLNPNDGWRRLPGPPSEEKAILAVAGDQINKRYAEHPGFEVVWFSRGADEYLIYFYATRNDYPDPKFRHCFEQVAPFKRMVDGWKSEGDTFPQMNICGYD